MWKALVRGVVLPPRPVVLDRLAVEVAGTNLVEARFDEDRYCSAGQSDFERFSGALKASADREVDVEIGQLCAEPARLSSASGGQRHRTGRIAADDARDVRAGLGVARDDEQTDRFTWRHCVRA
jgi:hypothetical protein